MFTTVHQNGERLNPFAGPDQVKPVMNGAETSAAHPRRLWRAPHELTALPRLGLIASYCSVGFDDIIPGDGTWWMTVSPPTPPQIVTLVEPVEVSVPCGTLTFPSGMRLRFVARDGESVRIRYWDCDAVIPLSATDLEANQATRKISTE